MSKIANGGTSMYCKKCGEVTVCKAVDPRSVSFHVKSGRRFYKTAHEDVHWFRRGRECLTCGHMFLSAEVREDFLTELTQLRDALGELKKHAEGYKAQSKKAAKSLSALTKSLDVLSALDSYQKQKPVK